MAGTLYKIRSGDPRMWWSEMNRVLSLISDRLDQIEGLRGNPKFYNMVEASDDVVVFNAERGLVLKDDGDPANYWRVTVDSTGTLQITSLGRSYE